MVDPHVDEEKIWLNGYIEALHFCLDLIQTCKTKDFVEANIVAKWSEMHKQRFGGN